MLRLAAILATLVVLSPLPQLYGEDKPHILIIVGPSNHPPGSHEVAAGGRLLQHCLANMKDVGPVDAEVVYRWPQAEQLRAASTIVFLGDTFPPNRFPNPESNLAQLQQAMELGRGIVCIHYATGLLGEDVAADGDHPLLQWLGGYFANRSCPHHESYARIFADATIQPAPGKHPILSGWDSFTLRDEPYINNYFGRNQNQLAENVTPLAISMLPPEKPQRETVAWCVERADQGRGFAVVMPHFFKNWRNEDLRRFILNGIVWTAQLDVPDRGVRSALPDLEQFEPASVNEVPRKRK